MKPTTPASAGAMLTRNEFEERIFDPETANGLDLLAHDAALRIALDKAEAEVEAMGEENRHIVGDNNQLSARLAWLRSILREIVADNWMVDGREDPKDLFDRIEAVLGTQQGEEK